jgi:hypothetical protein
MKIGLATLTVVALAGPVPAATPDLSGFDKVLVPIVLPTPAPGPQGSSQVTGKSIAVFSRQAVDFFPAYPSPASPPEVSTLAAEFPFITLEGPASGGRFVFFDKGRGEEVWLEHHLTVASKGGASERVPLPVVPEGDALVGTASILRVPFEWRYESDDLIREAIPVYRRVLRVYNFDDQPGEKVVVRLYLENVGPGPRPAFRTFEVALSRRDGAEPSFPYYGVLRLADICLPFSAHTPCLPNGSFRIELEPQSPGLRYWGFVSATDRVSQDVLVLEPRSGGSLQ